MGTTVSRNLSAIGIVEGMSVVAWIILLIAGMLEIGWAIGLKYSDGFSKPLPSVLTVAAMIASMVLLGLAVRTIPIGTGYAVWTGIGVAGTVVLGVLLLGEPLGVARACFLALILIGIVGLKFAS